MTVETISRHACFGGVIGFYRHRSEATGTDMRFGVYLPPGAAERKLPVLTYLAGLTCTEETFLIKAGAARFASRLGLILVAPDTSPRGLNLPGEDEDWDFGTGAGFYLNAAQPPWAGHYTMADYVTEELPAIIAREFPAEMERQGLFGHSMGGHGALVLALRNPGRYRSVSAFSPICNPCAVPWGEKAFSRYLGPDRAAWAEWDASALMRRRALPLEILVDQGLEDQFLREQLHPEALEAAAAESGQRLTLRRHPGYDHSYWFIQSFIEDHMNHHARALTG
ncbi:MAG TPA: S-formylglutathione hydrolase [Acetobacteraceae bacterium]|nr:S-formylglutathione hydrolase [Acetobacteraceae bacterium]